MRLLMLIIFTCLITLGIAYYIDPILYPITRNLPSIISDIFQIVTRFGDAFYAVPLVLLILVIDYLIYSKSLTAIIDILFKTLISMLLGSVVINFGKIAIGRARPKLFDSLGTFSFNPFEFGYEFASMPSGHTMTWAILAFSMALYFVNFRYLWILSAILVATSRIILGAHYLSDVFFSLVLSYLIVLLGHSRLCETYIESWRRKFIDGSKP